MPPVRCVGVGLEHPCPLHAKGASPSGPASPPLPALPGSVSAQALAPAADPPRYTFAPSASLNKTARPFGAPLPADSALQQNGYVGPAHPPPTPTPSVRGPTPPLPAAAQSALRPAWLEPCGSDPWRPGQGCRHWASLRVWLLPRYCPPGHSEPGDAPQLVARGWGVVSGD